MTYTACFARGTRIALPLGGGAIGELAVEALRAGDLVRLAQGGAARVVWLGRRRVDCARHPRPHDVLPVRVAAHAFAEGAPHRDLVLSPDHAVCVDGVLVPVRHLLNGATIAQVAAGDIEYWHVELAAHDVILAEGLAVESYLDTGNRGAFENAAAPALHPAFAPAAMAIWAARACAPLVLAGPVRDAAHAGLLARAQALGHVLGADAAPVLLVDGRRIAPVRHGQRLVFALPAHASHGSLVSRSHRPAECDATSDDHRTLGLPVTAIWRDRTALDVASLGDGWHAPEAALRWTTGHAAIPLAGARTLTIELAPLGRYWVETQAGQRASA